MRDGALHASPNAPTGRFGTFGVKAVATAACFADLAYEASITVGPQGDAGLIFRVTGAAIGPDAYLGYYAGISAGNGIAVLGRSDDGWTALGSVRHDFTAGTEYRLRVDAPGPRLRVSSGTWPFRFWRYRTAHTGPVQPVCDATTRTPRARGPRFPGFA